MYTLQQLDLNSFLLFNANSMKRKFKFSVSKSSGLQIYFKYSWSTDSLYKGIVYVFIFNTSNNKNIFFNPIPTGRGGEVCSCIFFLTFLISTCLSLQARSWAFILTAWVLRHTAWMTAFSCNKLNLCFDPLSVVRFC